ncbi:FKBP-type peptidyl-prolyl cis-trans isomerase [Desulfobacterota bacterium M19]
MKKILFLLVLTLSTNVWAANSQLNEKQKLGYALGMDIGASLKRMNPPIALPFLLKGLSDYYRGNRHPLLTPDQAYRIKKSYANEYRNHIATKKHRSPKNILKWRQETYQRNIAKANRFFSQNRSTPGVKETKSGMQYMVIKSGKGKIPNINDIVAVHYKAMTLDGTVFDSSYKNGTPAIFPLRKALKGWQEALTMMHVGSSYRIFLPAKLAYGQNGSGTYVKPGAGLIFTIELLKIVSPNEYQKSEAKRHKIPPYTAQGQSKILLPEKMPEQSVVHKGDVDLSTLESAGKAFMTLRNNILPVYRFENIKEICKAISTKEFLPSCISSLTNRVNWLKGLTGLKGAEFPNGSIKLASKGKNVLDIHWQEVLLFDNKTSKTNYYHLKVYYNKVNDEWRINKIKKI